MGKESINLQNKLKIIPNENKYRERNTTKIAQTKAFNGLLLHQQQ